MIFLFLTGATWLFAADIGPDNFRYKASIDGQIRKNAIYRIILGSNVLEKCDNACSDIRIYDGDKREVPYILLDNLVPVRNAEASPLEVKSYADNNGAQNIILERTEHVEPVTRMYLETDDQDFRKAVSVSGSNDRSKWEALGEDSIYDFSSQIDLRKTFVTIKKNTYKYLRFTMKEQNSKKSKSQNIHLKYEGLDLNVKTPVDKKLQIDRFLAQYFEESSESKVYDELVIKPQISNDDSKKVTEMLIEIPFPVASIVLSIDNPYYLRPVRLLGSATKKEEDFVLIQQTSLHNLSVAGQKEIKNSIEIPSSARYRFYRIIIENQANPPLKCEKVTLRWIQKQTFFIALEDNRHYSLALGSPSVGAVEYDISALITQNNWFDQRVELMKISAALQNTGYKPIGDRETRARIEKYILTGIIIFLVLVVGFFLYQLWKKASITKP
jgi:hypothetical protein